MADKQRVIANKALNVARRVISDPTLVANELAIEMGVNRGTVRDARVILEYGTAQHLSDAMAGSAGLSAIAKAVRKSMTDDQKQKVKKRTGTWTESRRENLLGEASIWAKLGPSLRGLSELPNPRDVVAVVKRQKQRETTVIQHLETASHWLEEFVNAWNEIARSPADNVDAGNGNSASGAQSTKSAA